MSTNVVSTNVEDIYRLSPLQQGILFHSIAAPDPRIYVQQVLFNVVGPIDEGKLRRAWQEVVAEHPVLRTAFVWEGVDEPVQVVLRSIDLPQRQADLRSHSEADRLLRAEQMLEEDRGQGFVLGKAPLMRVLLIRMEDQRSLLAWTYHHLILDGWSLPIVLGSVLERYAAPAPALARRTRPYRDFIEWLSGQDRGKAEAYWRGVLSGFTSPTPIDLGRPREIGASHGSEKLQVPQPVLMRLERFCREGKVTSNTLVQGAWALLLSRFSGCRDVVFGATVGGRPPELAGAEAMVGLFINTVPVRFPVAEDETVLAWLRERQRAQAEQREYEQSALVDIQRWSALPPGKRLFDSIVVFENFPLLASAAAAGSPFRIEPLETRELTDSPLTLVAGTDSGLSLRLEFDRARFDAALAKQILQRLLALLEQLATHPDMPLREVPVLTADDRAALKEARQENLPELPDGPLDHRSLAEPERLQAERYVGPRTPVERELCQIWSNVLELEQVGIQSGFFELGGNSILALTAVAKAREAFGVDLSVRRAFELRDIVAWATEVELLQKSGRPPEPPLARRAGPRQARMSYAQHRLWFLHHWDRADPTYHIPGAVRISGEISVDRLRRALQLTAARHESLRTIFRADGAELIQIVTDDVAISLEVVNAEGLSDSELRALVTRHVRQPFEMSERPPIRAAVFFRSTTEAVLLLTMHHIIADDWSLGIIVRDLIEAYESRAGGPDPAVLGQKLTSQGIEYIDYSEWQREWFESGIGGEQLASYRARLAGERPRLALGGSSRPLAGQPSAGGREWVQMAPELRRRMLDLARREGVTSFVVALAAYQILLCRYTSEVDLWIGTPVTMRTRPELRTQVGMLINTVVLRTDLSGDPTVREVLERARRATAEAFAHKDVPFEKIVEALRPAQGGDGSALFQAAIVMEAQHVESISARSLKATPYDVDTGTAKFGLTLSIQEGPSTRASLEYDAHELTRTLARQMLEHWCRIVDAMGRDLDARLSDIPMLRDAEVERWTLHPARVPCIEAALPARFERTAAAFPDATAVSSEQARLTYRELNQRANRLARHLRAHGAGPERHVVLWLERSPELVVALLAVLKTGAAYVPVDPQYPPERIRWILQDAGAELVVADAAHADQLAGGGADIVHLQRDAEAIAGHSELDLALPIDGDQPAYVIYTSGSTGRPKGVVVSHANVVRLFASTEGWACFGPRDVVTLFHSVAFDFSVWELWGALLHGGRLVVVPYFTSREPQAFRELLASQGVTVLSQTPSAFASLIAADELRPPGELAALRLVVFGGEALDFGALRPWVERHGLEQPALVNMYGITETTVHVTQRRITAADVARGPSYIGLALPHLEAYVLGPGLELMPSGGVGELYIGGGGLAHGYWNRPSLTAERFVPHPFAQTPGARLYRTGDRARATEDGDLEYLGRRDQQVKLRGFRIELGEIEAVLREHPAIDQCCVSMREDEPGGRRLVAHVVFRRGQALDAAEMRAHLQARLPAHMVPAAFVGLSELPVTVHGKLDRSALPPPRIHTGCGANELAPQSELEQQLARIFADVLGLGSVGADGHFFALGGDSISSLQVIARAAQASIRITPRQIFEHPTVAGLAAVAQPLGVVRAEQDVLVGEFALSPIQGWFFEQRFAVPQHFNQSLVLQSKLPIEPERFRRAARSVLAQHDALRLRFRQVDGRWLQHFGPSDPDGAVRTLVADGERGARQFVRDVAAGAQRGLELDRCLARFWLVSAPEGESWIVLAVHHLCIDGVSWRILIEDLARAYQQARGGADPALGLKTSSYRQWVEALHGALAADVGRRELAHWSRLLAPHSSNGAPASDNAAAESQRRPAGGALLPSSMALGVEDSDALVRGVKEKLRAGPEHAVLAALVEVVGAAAEAAAVCIDVESHGREDFGAGLDLSRTIGWFTAIYPVVLTRATQLSRRERIVAVRDQLRQVPHAGAGYGLLAYLGGPEARAATRGAAPRTLLFNYLGQFELSLEENGWSLLEEPVAGVVHEHNRLPYDLEVNAVFHAGSLRLSWSSPSGRHDVSRLRQLSEAVASELAHMARDIRGGASLIAAADFPDTGLSQGELDDLLARIGA